METRHLGKAITSRSNSEDGCLDAQPHMNPAQDRSLNDNEISRKFALAVNLPGFAFGQKVCIPVKQPDSTALFPQSPPYHPLPLLIYLLRSSGKRACSRGPDSNRILLDVIDRLSHDLIRGEGRQGEALTNR